LLFGIVPAMQLSRPDFASALKDGPRTGGGTARQRWRSVLVVSEVALAVVLLVGAALFIGSFLSLIRIDPGFSPDHVLIAQVSPRVASRTEPADSRLAFSQIVERIGSAAGVVHASMTSGSVPLEGFTTMTTFTIPGKDMDRNSPDAMISTRSVTPDYHSALKIPLRDGRLFNATDRQGAVPVVIINEAAAKKYFPTEDPIGRTVYLHEDRVIVGVVGDIHQASLEVDPRAEAYTPLDQGRVSGGQLIVRTSGNPYDVLPAVKAAVYAVLPDVPLRNVGTMEEMVAKRLAQRRLSMLLLGLFGLLGLVIAAVGVYGLMAFVVSQRTREIGVRIALGASQSRVVRMVLIKAAVLVTIGLVIGSVAAWFLSATAAAFLFRLEPTDPRAFAAAVGSLVVASLLATAIPARRAALVDPIVALRSE
jgi:putative ABC transport system permease protein